MFKEELESMMSCSLESATTAQIYEAVLALTQEKINQTPQVHGERTIYYMSAEFLIGKLLSNNLMNLGIYDDLKNTLAESGHNITDIEAYEPEPSLGNGGLGRLAACFMDSIATLGLNGQGLGLVYHYGLFKQVFAKNLQHEEKDAWLDKPGWLNKTDFATEVMLGDVKVTGRMYQIDILGYNGEKAPLRLFDLESLDDSIIEAGIQFNQQAIDKNLTLFLYPDDSTEAGQRLRFIQQYFMVSCGLAWILKEHGDHLDHLDEFVTIQINDTHPSMVILLLLREMLNKGISFDHAVKVISNTCAYTNHTILAEALEKWPLHYFEAMDPELVTLLHRLDEVGKTRSQDPSTAVIDHEQRVHMASLAIHFSKSTNGVAALHTEILKNSELKPFFDIYPERFNNKTNGITFRRWLMYTNKPLTNFIETRIGDGFKRDAMELQKLEEFTKDEKSLKELLAIKDMKKQELADFILATENIKINPHSIYDIQIKRMHEYKRQQMNLLYAIHMYQEIKKGNIPSRPITLFFGAKAAPAYTIAKDIIHALLTLAEVVHQDPQVNQHLQIVFVENYNVTKAEMLIPASDISEQISLASKEASGTGNMKFMLNGALTLGTMDGANVEICELVGQENIYIFGESSDEIINHYKLGDYHPSNYYNHNEMIRNTVDFINGLEMLAFGKKENLDRLHHELITKDWFMTLIDLESYIETKNRMISDYENRLEWAQKMLINISRAGFFSSDRTIEEYNRDIWKV